MEKLLTIAIPTYNRVEKLTKTLHSIFKEITDSSLNNKVDIVISDNGSPESPFERVNKCNALFPEINVLFKRSEKNLGFAGNYWRVIRMAGGKYILVTGDDDEFIPGSLLPIIKVLEEKSPPLLLLRNISGNRLFANGCTKPDGKLMSVNIHDYFSFLGVFHGSFIGNAVYCRRDFNRLCPTDEALESAYPHMAVILRFLEKDNILFFNHSCLEVCDDLRPWLSLQAVYSAIDIPRLVTFFAPVKFMSMKDILLTYKVFFPSLVKVFIQIRKGLVKPDCSNPYQDVSFSNVMKCYSASWITKVLAFVAIVFRFVGVLVVWQKNSGEEK